MCVVKCSEKRIESKKGKKGGGGCKVGCGLMGLAHMQAQMGLARMLARQAHIQTQAASHADTATALRRWGVDAGIGGGGQALRTGRTGWWPVARALPGRLDRRDWRVEHVDGPATRCRLSIRDCAACDDKIWVELFWESERERD